MSRDAVRRPDGSARPPIHEPLQFEVSRAAELIASARESVARARETIRRSRAIVAARRDADNARERV